MTSCSTWSFPAFLRSCICPSMDLWRELECSNCMSLPLHLAFMWLQLTMCWEEPPSTPCSWLATQPLQSHTRSAGSRVQVSLWAVQTQLLQMAGVAATCMKSTSGCGKFGMASHAWVGLTVDETATREKTLRVKHAKRSAETRRRRRADGVWSNEVCCSSFVQVCTCIC